MKEILKITASLTAVCVAASLILGAVYTQTEHARKKIEKAEKEELIKGLLGFGHGHEPPADLMMHSVQRYVISDPSGSTLLGYVVPVKEGKFVLVEIDLQGKPVKVLPVDATAAQLAEAGTRDLAVNKALTKGGKAVYAETFYVADKGGSRFGYVLPGVTQGFKTFVELMVSLDPKFTIMGVAVEKHEEDPGLGAEITQDYFKNQFAGKTLETLAGLKVVKEPLPADYVEVLDPVKTKRAKLTPEQIKEIKQKHLKDDIYALTGATISSNALTRGVKDTVRKFVYRFDILKKAIDQEKVQVAF